MSYYFHKSDKTLFIALEILWSEHQKVYNNSVLKILKI